jgi:hypothetical protein
MFVILMGAKLELQLNIRCWKMQTSNLVPEKTQPIVRSSAPSYQKSFCLVDKGMTTKGPQAMDIAAKPAIVAQPFESTTSN